MKKLFLLFVFIASSVLPQQYSQTEIEKFEKVILFALKSHNDGVVERMIFQIVLCGTSGRKVLITDNVLNELAKLHITGNSKKNQKLSGLAYEFFTRNDADLVLNVKDQYHDEEKMFRVLSQALNGNQLRIAEH